MKRTFIIFIAMLMATITFAQILSPGVYIQEVPSSTPAIEAVETSTAIFIGHTQKAVRKTKRIHSLDDFQRHFGSSAKLFHFYESVKLFFQNGGKTCHIVSAGGLSLKPTLSTLSAALIKSKKLDGQIVTIPDAVLLSERDFFRIQNQLLNTCKSLGDRFAILSTKKPSTNINSDIEKFRAGINPSAFGAVYYPWVQIKGKPIPPVGVIAGIYAQQDSKRGVWKAPANIQISGIHGLTNRISNQEQSTMNVDPVDGKSINALRVFSGKGNIVWGARTLAGNDNEWRYISVRRFSNMIENSIKEGLSWVVFEPNNSSMWYQARASVENFLNTMWRNGALQGAIQRDAFYVKCGLNETMTQSDIINGRLILEIGMAVVRPAEFTTMKFEFKVQ